MAAGAHEPGWYPDPTGRHTHRYHDGRGWTVHVADDGSPSVDASGLDWLNAPPPGAPPRAGAGDAAPRPEPGASNAGYWVAGILGVLTVLAAIAAGVLGLIDTLSRPDDFARGPVPGTVVTTVHDPGGRVIYYEGGGRPSAGALGLTVTGPDGAAVPVRGYGASVTYDVSGHSGQAVARFDARTAGRYRVTSTAAAGPGGGLAVGSDLGASLVWLFVRPVLILVGGALLAGAIALITVFRRRPPRAPVGLT